MLRARSTSTFDTGADEPQGFLIVDEGLLFRTGSANSDTVETFIEIYGSCFSTVTNTFFDDVFLTFGFNFLAFTFVGV